MGRPGRGGYKIAETLGWDARQYDDVMVSEMDGRFLCHTDVGQARVARLASEHLISKPNDILSRQPKEEVHVGLGYSQHTEVGR